MTNDIKNNEDNNEKQFAEYLKNFKNNLTKPTILSKEIVIIYNKHINYFNDHDKNIEK